MGRAIAFIQASPDEALKLVAAFPGQIETAEKLAWRWRVQNPLFASAETVKNGPLWMTPELWNNMGHFFHDAQQVPRFVPAGEIMTTAFLPKPAAG